MCGEHLREIGQETAQQGSSPHVRGALISSDTIHLTPGIIPACAGSTQPLRERSAETWDHPRMCGEHSLVEPIVNSPPGSSPHVRGAHSQDEHKQRLAGIIPACAGSTRPRPRRQPVVRDHPRMCGEHSLNICGHMRDQGSSPHVRGAHGQDDYSSDAGGIIPACAGSTRSRLDYSRGKWDHPRMCGEHTSKIA